MNNKHIHHIFRASIASLLLLGGILWLPPASSHAAIQTIFQETFETDGNGTRYNTTPTECTDNSADYFLRTNGNNISGIYNSPEGNYFFAGMDINATDCPAATSLPATITFNSINIANYTNLTFKGLFAEDDDGANQDWDAPDFVHIDYQIDGGGWTPLIWFENDGSTYNTAPLQDLNFDGVGDGAEITDTFTEFAANIAGTGTNLDIRVQMNLDAGDEDIAIDNLYIKGNNGIGAYHPITVDGNLAEWDSGSELLGTNDSSSGIGYYTTWDETYLYIGIDGGNATSDKYNVAIDIDPDDAGASNSGTSNTFSGAIFGTDGKPDYVMQIDGSGTVTKKTGVSNWVTDWVSANSIVVDNNNSSGVAEFRFSWADMGVTSRNVPVGIYLWESNSSDELWGAYPPTNPNSWSGNTEYLSTRIYLPTTDNGRMPRTYAQHLGDQTQFNANGTFSLLNGFAAINITSGGGAGCNFKITVHGNRAASVDNNSIRRRYDIEPSGCAPTADITLQYMDGNYNAPDERNGYADSNNLKLYRWNGSTWVNEGGVPNDGLNTVAKTNVSAFSPWTFNTDGTSPTAVSLQSISATSQHTGLIITIIAILLLITGSAWVQLRKR